MFGAISELVVDIGAGTKVSRQGLQSFTTSQADGEANSEIPGRRGGCSQRGNKRPQCPQHQGMRSPRGTKPLVRCLQVSQIAILPLSQPALTLPTWQLAFRLSSRRWNFPVPRESGTGSQACAPSALLGAAKSGPSPRLGVRAIKGVYAPPPIPGP